MIEKIKKFLTARSGNVAVSLAVIAMPLLGSAGLAVDYTMLNRAKSALQEAADSAALASAKELGLSNARSSIVSEVAKRYVHSTLLNSLTIDNQKNRLDINPVVAKDKSAITVTLSYYWTPFILHHLYKEALPVRISATAKLAGTNKICMIGLDETTEKTIHLTKKAKLAAEKCGVYANSTHYEAIRVDDNAQILSGVTCSAGGIQRKKKSSFVPDPVTNCPPIADPLIERDTPKVGSCDYTGFEVKSGEHTLKPGTYCKGLKIKKTARVKLQPGVYVITDGRLEVTDKAKLEGKNVGFYLSGNKAKLVFKKETTINLTAPHSGIMAGLLVFEDRNASSKIQKHEINSDNARMLLGTIYLPNGTLKIDSEAPVADKAAYTAIIARKIELREGPTLHLNSDYDATDIPVPEGLVNDEVLLTR